MKRFSKICAVLLAVLAVSVSVFSPVHAAPNKPAADQKRLVVKINIYQPKIFWNYSFLNKEGDLGKPAAVKLTWSHGDMAKNEQTQVVITQGKSSGHIDVWTEKNELLNLIIKVYDAKGNRYGSTNIQVRNKGQVETFFVGPPEFSEPQFGWSNAQQ